MSGFKPSFHWRRLRSGWTWFLVVMAAGIAAAEETKPRPLEKDRAAKLIHDLDHEDYHVRSKATRELTEAGSNALPPLIAALPAGSLERRMRIVDLLGRIYSLGEEESFEPAELALEQIKQTSAGSLGAHARLVLETNYEARQKLAVAAIQRLGGSVLYNRSNNPPGVEDVDPDEEERPKTVAAVVIGREWTGGDEGLRHIRRLSRLSVMYRVKTAPVSDEAIEALKDDMRGLRIESRGAAYLGITPENNGRGCFIQRVQPESAAAKAGVEPRDVITYFDGERVTDPQQLIQLIGKKEPGNSVPITVERNGQTLELKAELTGWPKELAP
jgi:hypothetical protein